MVVHVFVEPVADLIAAGATELLDDAERDHADSLRPDGGVRPAGAGAPLVRSERVRDVRAERVRDGYVAGRALTRAAVSALTGVDPAEIRVRSTAAGKPVLEGVGVAHSVSHTAGLVAVAVASDPSGSLALGVDIEAPRALPQYRSIAERYFTASERAWLEPTTASDPATCVERPAQPARLHTMPESAEDRFVQIWCRKEAAIKALGLTIGNMGELATTDAPGVGTDSATDGHTTLRGDRRWAAQLAGSTPSVTGFDLSLDRAGVSDALGALGVVGSSPDGGVQLELHRVGTASALVAAVLGSDRAGSDRAGSDRAGSDRAGSDRAGSPARPALS